MTHPLAIAVVEDNDTLRDLLVSYLEQSGRRVFSADCGEALNDILAVEALDIVVLDLNLPYEDGLSIAQRLRKSHPQIKIVMLTARVRPSDRTAGYSMGADVYLTKPTNVAELEAVVRNLGSRKADVPEQTYVLNRRAHVLTAPRHQQVVLTAVESLILEQLVMAPAEGLHVEVLIAELQRQDGSDLTRDNLAVIISRLRRKIEVEFGATPLIQAVRSFGYRLLQPIVLR